MLVVENCILITVGKLGNGDYEKCFVNRSVEDRVIQHSDVDCWPSFA